MRIIAQNSDCNIPYEDSAFWIVKKEGNYDIIGCFGEYNPIMGTYSTEAKAIKAMEILAKAGSTFILHDKRGDVLTHSDTIDDIIVDKPIDSGLLFSGIPSGYCFKLPSENEL